MVAAGTLLFAGDSSGVLVEVGTAVGLGGRVGIEAGLVVAEAGGWVDAPWHAARSNAAAVTNSPKARLRNPMSRC